MPAKSRRQRRLMGIIRAIQKGENVTASDYARKLAARMNPKDVRDFARTKHNGLPDELEKSAWLWKLVQKIPKVVGKVVGKVGQKAVPKAFKKVTSKAGKGVRGAGKRAGGKTGKRVADEAEMRFRGWAGAYENAVKKPFAQYTRSWRDLGSQKNLNRVLRRKGFHAAYQNPLYKKLAKKGPLGRIAVDALGNHPIASATALSALTRGLGLPEAVSAPSDWFLMPGWTGITNVVDELTDDVADTELPEGEYDRIPLFAAELQQLLETADYGGGQQQQQQAPGVTALPDYYGTIFGNGNTGGSGQNYPSGQRGYGQNSPGRVPGVETSLQSVMPLLMENPELLTALMNLLASDNQAR